MSIDDLIGGLLGGSPTGENSKPDAGSPDLGGPAGGAGGLDLSALLGSLLGGGSPTDSGSPDLGGLAGGAGGLDLGALLGGLLGGGNAAAPSLPDLTGLAGVLSGASGEQGGGQPGLDVNGLAEGMGLSPSILQAAIPLVLGGLLKGNIPGRMGDQPPDEAAVRATGVPQELAARTGLDLPKAVLTVQQVLEWLRKATKPLGASGAHRPAHASKPAVKKKPRKQAGSSHAASTARPKRPKSSASASHAGHSQGSGGSKPRSKPKPKPATTARPKRPSRTTSKSGPAE